MKKIILLIALILILFPITINAQSIIDLDSDNNLMSSMQEEDEEEKGFIQCLSIGPDFGFFLNPDGVFGGLRINIEAMNWLRFGGFGNFMVDIENFDPDVIFFDNVTTYFGAYAGLFYRMDKFYAGFDFSVAFAYDIMLYPRIFVEYDIWKNLRLGLFGGYMMTFPMGEIHHFVGGIAIRFNIYF
jgi:hypothetical protein